MSRIDFESVMQELRMKRYEDIATYEEIIKLGIEAKWKGYCSKNTSPDIDSTDIFAEEMEYLKDLEYSMKLMIICCLSETWEQDLYNFLKEKGLITIPSNDYARTKQIFESAYPTCAISRYTEIGEMRALVNAIKHGEGNSLNNIRRRTDDAILADSNIGFVDETGQIVRKKEIDFDCNTLTSRTLKIDGKLDSYSEAIVGFWSDVYQADKERAEAPTRE